MGSFDIYSGRVRVRASALVVNDDKLLLVQQKVPTRSQLVWLPPGGGIQPGEPAENALIREVVEETGIQVKPYALRYVHEFIQGAFHAYELYFTCEYKNGDPVKGNDPEHRPEDQLIVDVQWVPMQKLSQIELFPQFLRNEAKRNAIFNDTISHFKTT